MLELGKICSIRFKHTNTHLDMFMLSSEGQSYNQG